MTLKFFLENTDTWEMEHICDIPTQIAHRVGYNDYSFSHSYTADESFSINALINKTWFELSDSDERIKNLPDNFVIGTVLFGNIYQTPVNVYTLKVLEGKIVFGHGAIEHIMSYDPGSIFMEGYFRI